MGEEMKSNAVVDGLVGDFNKLRNYLMDVVRIFECRVPEVGMN